MARGLGQSDEAGGGNRAREIPAPLLTADQVETKARERGIFVIGLTGPFGSGCSTAAQLLEAEAAEQKHPPYVRLKLSDFLHDLLGDDDRDALQDLGNRIRHDEGNAALVVRGLGAILSERPEATRIAIDGIRNLGEVRWLRHALGERFSLFAIVADTKVRFNRQGSSMNWAQFYELDQRDQGESENYGQQVNRCVDLADVLLPNMKQTTTWKREFGKRLRSYAALVEGRSHRFATPQEMLMNAAYAASHGSKCVKRQVGCMVAIDSEPLASGYNENPTGLKPCIEQFETCYRDIVRVERFHELSLAGAKCPYCSAPIPSDLFIPWSCPNCEKSLDSAFFPDRAMKWCTALHAEERALINAGDRDLSEACLYATTFPCMLCAEKIIHAGIREVVYIEAYPDAHGEVLFKEAGVKVGRFEGVRSRNFELYFSGTQPEMEKAAVANLKDLGVA